MTETGAPPGAPEPLPREGVSLLPETPPATPPAAPRLALDVTIVLMLVVFAFLLRQWHLGLPETRFFDETYYAKSGEELLAGKPDSNTVHPPLAKLFIATTGWCYTAVGQPLQEAGWVGGVTDWARWRAGSLLFGLLTLPLTYLLARRLYASRFCATTATFLVAIDFLHLVQSRIAMLDAYLSFFVMLGAYAAWRFITSDRDMDGWAFLSVLAFAIGFACKWSSLFAAFGAVLAMLSLKRYSAEASTRLDAVARTLGWTVLLTPIAHAIYPSAGWGVSAVQGALGAALLHVSGVVRVLPPLRGPGLWFTRLSMLYLVLVPAMYLVSFVPFLWQHQWDVPRSWTDAVKNHKVMINFRYSKEFTHRYMSSFWSWPTMMRPVWYHYEEHKDPEGSPFPPDSTHWVTRLAWRGKEPGSYITGILAMGSPFVWWTFLVFLALTTLQSVILPLFTVVGEALRGMRTEETPPVPSEAALVSSETASEPSEQAPVARPDAFGTFRAAFSAARCSLDAWRFGPERPWLFLLLMYAPQVLLWSVNRGFLFYMLPCVPFMSIFIAAILQEWLDLPYGRTCSAAYLVIATLFLVAYYPLLAGISIPKPVYEVLVFTPKWI